MGSIRTPPTATNQASFVLLTCQVGAERAVKHEMAVRWPDARFSYSRPGFLTFKFPPELKLPDTCPLDLVFARSQCLSLGKVSGSDDAELSAAFWELAAGRPCEALHVWQRDTQAPGFHGFEPSITAEALEARQAIVSHAPDELRPSLARAWQRPTRTGHLVMDVIVVEPRHWWVGYHRVDRWPSRWPGGICPIQLPEHAVSRAWLKMEEALRWSQLPLKLNQRCAEIGSAPGGASQALLDRGLYVLGIDPAEMDPQVLAHPKFTHLRKRGREVRRREFRKVRWLLADMNVAPDYTLDTVEAIATHREINLRGMLLTLKLLDWDLAAQVPYYLERVRSWGFAWVAARQLVHNRQEVTLAALRKAPAT